MFYRLIYTKLDKAPIVRQWNSETAGCCNQYVVLFEKYLHVCDFLSFGDEAWYIYMLTFMNKMSDFVLHYSYCSSLPMKWHPDRFLYSTFNMLCGSLNRLLTVWRCTEILLYSNRWVGLYTDSKVTVVRYLLLLLLLLLIIIIIIIVIIIISSSSPPPAPALPPYFELIHNLHCRNTKSVQSPHYKIFAYRSTFNLKM